MTRLVLVAVDDAAQRAAVEEAVRAAGGEPVLTSSPPSGLQLRAAIGAGEGGLAVLARLALERPPVPRVALVAPDSTAESLVEVVGRAQPFRVVREAASGKALGQALAEALLVAPSTPPLVREVRGPARPVRDFSVLTRDPRTGVLGHQYLRLRLEEELERTSRYARPISLVLMDIDDLGALNDRWGRAIVDGVLAQVANALVAGARAVDHVGRWTGGTFALVLPETAGGSALGTADRIRADLAARRFPATRPGELQPASPEAIRLTVSCGLGSATSAHQAQTLLTRVVSALARAKALGGNRSVVDG